MADGASHPYIAPANAEADRPIDVVYFAGAGGSSEAYRIALGKHPDVALNHNATAIGVHMANCPETEHFIADVFDIDPTVIRPGVKWRSFWASPDCRHFSKAKGSAPVSPRVRGLAWVVVKVAKLLGDLAPDVIFLENVEEFVDWGPLLPPDDKGLQRPDPARRGETFGLWCQRLRQCGYVVEYKVDWVAADYGAPTTRKRLILIARRDGLKIVWPSPTHANRKVAKAKGLKPYVPAADCIDFSLPCPSIFLTQAQCREQGIRAKRPLEPATLARIAKGVMRYVIATGDPFIVPIQNWSHERVHSVDDPLRTITAWPKGGAFAVVQPTLQGGAVVGCGSRAGQSPPRGLDDPLGTIIGKADRCLATAYLTKFSENSIGEDPAEPLHTVMAGAPRHGLVEVLGAFVEQANTGMVGREASEPLSTIVQRGTTQRLITAHLDYAYGSNDGAAAGDPRDALKTITAGGSHHFLLQEALQRPFAAHGDELRAFLVKYYGTADAADLADPMHSVVSRARFGLVVVSGQVMQITDIGMRMLTPAELAAAQGFPKSYRTNWNAATGTAVTKTDETRLIGNSVSPIAAAPFIAANLPALAADREIAA